MIASIRRPDFLHQCARFWFGHALHVAVIAIDEGRDAHIGNAVDMHWRCTGIVSGDERIEMRVIGLIERHRDVGVGKASRSHQFGLALQRTVAVGQGEVDDMAHTERGEPLHVARRDLARGRSARVDAQPCGELRLQQRGHTRW